VVETGCKWVKMDVNVNVGVGVEVNADADVHAKASVEAVTSGLVDVENKARA
jgi:hypothetical protein